MIEKIALESRGGPAGLGSAFAVTTVDPRAWFFHAHFFQDPVCPGSLGLETLFQAGKALAVLLFGAGDDKTLKWSAPALNRPHEWLYRGQVTPAGKEAALGLAVREMDEVRRLLTFDGLLSVDGLPIYKMEGFTLGLDRAAGPVRRRVTAPEPPAPDLTPEMILNWRRTRRLSQGQLAKLMGVTSIYVSLMERGKRNISPLMAEKLNVIFRSPAGGAGPEPAGLTRDSFPNRGEDQTAAGLITPDEMRARRKARGLSQRKLAEEVGVTAALIGLIELGKRNLSLDLAQKILAVLKD